MAVRMAPDVQGVQDVCKAQLRVVWGTILFRVFWWCLGCVEPSCPQSDTEHRACSIMLANKHSIWTVLLIYDHKLHKQWVTANQLSRFTLTGKLSTWHHSSLSHTKTKPSQLRSTHSLTHTGEQNTNANTPLISPVTADHPTHTHPHDSQNSTENMDHAHQTTTTEPGNVLLWLNKSLTHIFKTSNFADVISTSLEINKYSIQLLV